MAVEKHINFFELQAALEKPGCPLCAIIGNRAERYIDNMLFEHVSDRSFRAQYRAAGGFCGRHSRHLESFRDGLAVAILGRDLLEDRLAALQKSRPYAPKGRCPVCEEEARLEREYLGFLLQTSGDSADERELRDAFCASDGLCFPHYGLLLDMARRGRRTFRRAEGRQASAWLQNFQEGRFRDLLRRSSVFIELSAYGRQEEFRNLSAGDQVVWKELSLSLRGGKS
ncbi:MAG: DUF6062 family protein [Treponema sp.]|jgi:hypothetical protein|nr:DUF6062 family protein [Treponema sp.]